MAERNEEKPRVITREEQEAIMLLPIREFKFAGVLRRGRYDEENSKFYFLNEDGLLEGRVATVTFRDKPPDSETAETQIAEEKTRGSTPLFFLSAALRKLAGATEDEIKGNAATADSTAEADLPSEESPPEGKPKNNRKLILAIAACAAGVLVLTGVLYWTAGALIRMLDNPSADDLTPARSSLDTIQVIQVARDLIPGDKLSANDLQSASISAADYNMINTNGSPLYQWSRCEDLLQTTNYITEYIPRGLYLSYDNVSGVNPLPGNPWTASEEGFRFTVIPITESLRSEKMLSFGAMLDIAVQKSAQRSSAVAQGEVSEIDGMRISTIREDRYGYSLNGCVICDLLDQEKRSLFPRYAGLMAIPTGEQITYLRNLMERNPETASSLTACYLVIKLTEAQATELGELESGNVSIELRLTGSVDRSTDTKQRIAEETAVLRDNLLIAARRTDETGEQLNGT